MLEIMEFLKSDTQTDQSHGPLAQNWTNWTLNEVIRMFQAETRSDAEYVFGVGIWKMHILLIRFLDKLKEKLNPKKTRIHANRAQGQ
ncbi:uncharacterized protein LOC143450623 isoform X5 [Clavelina lepadiformis]|uniref:uncharacterized protein LOC143450623 isoform X5 n=1 Tax=Clavelina lepadiformis TaxID=159417 RepID=UPI0040428BC0